MLSVVLAAVWTAQTPDWWLLVFRRSVRNRPGNAELRERAKNLLSAAVAAIVVTADHLALARYAQNSAVAAGSDV